ncbi:3'-5' exonuclease [Novispirillum sp. DQ9]|uniref:3'-5' exonuclease n=1 Tax=Novispirillum sp. DQ9 TaxID=3398612 RepID=UPI003C7E548A
MLHTALRALNRRRLKDPAYDFLFGPEHPDEVVVFDCETSGLDPRKAELLSLAAIRVRGGRILTSQALEMVIRPGAAIDQEAIKVHHLRNVDVESGIDARQAIDRFLRFVGTRPLVGYYLEFDVAMVNRIVKPWLGVGLPQRQTEVSALYYDMRTRRTRGETYTGMVDLGFDVILRDLDLPRLAAHDAFNDALMTAMMFVKLRSMTGG